MLESKQDNDLEHQYQKRLAQESLLLLERLKSEKAKKYKGIAVVLDKYSSKTPHRSF